MNWLAMQFVTLGGATWTVKHLGLVIVIVVIVVVVGSKMSNWLEKKNTKADDGWEYWRVEEGRE